VEYGQTNQQPRYKKQAGQKYITHKTMRTGYEGHHVFMDVEKFSAKLLDTKQE